MDKLLKEIEQFERWADEYSDIPQDERGGEWECDYSNWSAIWSEFERFLSDNNVLKISDYQFEKILYIIARDNENQSIIEMIAENAELLMTIAEKGLTFKSIDSKWQIVDKLNRLTDMALAKMLLVKYIKQENEYVTRMAIKTLVD